MMYESLVRACTVRYTRKHQGQFAAMKQILSDKQRQFHWIGELSALLGTYEKQRSQYQKLDVFAPKIVAFFDDYAETFAQAHIAQDSTQPKVVTMTPANGAKDVDPALAIIKVTFDRPMKDQSWSLVGGGPHFPEITGKPRFDPRARSGRCR